MKNSFLWVFLLLHTPLEHKSYKVDGFYVRYIPRIFRQYQEGKQAPVVEGKQEPIVEEGLKDETKDDFTIARTIPRGSWIISPEKDRQSMMKQSILWIRTGGRMEKKWGNRILLWG